MKKTIALLISLALLAIPAVSSAATLSELQTQLQSLLSQVSLVQQEIAVFQSPSTSTESLSTSFMGTTTPPTPIKGCPTLLYSLQKGSTDATTNGEVSSLQQLLAEYPSIYPEGLVTGFFGSSTAEALGRLQVELGVIPSATSTSFGLLGPLTRSAIVKWCGPSTPILPAGGNSTSTPSACTSSGSKNLECIGVTAPVTSLPSISIDRSALIASTSTPTITGEAQNLTSLILTLDGGTSTVFENNSVPVTDGVWSATTTSLLDGAYKVTVRSTAGNAIASGYLIVSTATTTPTNPAPATSTPIVPPVTSSTITPIYSFPTGSGTPKVTVSANGSTAGASVLVDARALIAWNATLSSSCLMSSSNPNSLSGSVPTFSTGLETGPLSQTTTFTLTCSGSSGEATGSVTVSVQTSSSNGPNQVFIPGIVIPIATSTTLGPIVH